MEGLLWGVMWAVNLIYTLKCLAINMHIYNSQKLDGVRYELSESVYSMT